MAVPDIIKSVFQWVTSNPAGAELKTTFARTIGLAGVVIHFLSAMLPGIFVTPTFAAEIMGPGIWFAFLLAGSVVIFRAPFQGRACPPPCQSAVVLRLQNAPTASLVGTISGLGLWRPFC